MIKTTGIEFKRFYADSAFWFEGVWHDDECITVDGVDIDPDIGLDMVDDVAKMKIEGGVVYLPGVDQEKSPSFEAYFKRWRRGQNVTVLVVEVPNDSVATLKESIKLAGGKVVS